MQPRPSGKFRCWLVHGGAVLLVGMFCVCSDAMHEQAAWQMLHRVGGHAESQSGPGYDRIFRVCMSGTSPSAADLATLVPLRSLQIIDLSMSKIGDRELLALVGCRALTIIVPHGRTSLRAHAHFAEGRIAIGIGPGVPGALEASPFAASITAFDSGDALLAAADR